MVVACSYKILWPKINFFLLHILACFGPFLECKKAQNWNGLEGHVYGSINLKFFWGLPRPICNYPPKSEAEIQFFFFGPGYSIPWVRCASGNVFTLNSVLANKIGNVWTKGSKEEDGMGCGDNSPLSNPDILQIVHTTLSKDTKTCKTKVWE